MRAALFWLFPYFLLFALLNIPQTTQEKISLRMQEWKWGGGFLLHSSDKTREVHVPIQEEVKPAKSCFLDTSPWIEAHVIAHKQFPWSHMAWIDVGMKTEGIPFPITVGCPVVSGRCLLGIVEKVGDQMTCVRLLSDPLLRPAVRVQRKAHDDRKEKAVYLLMQELQENPSLVSKESHRQALQKLLSTLASTFEQEKSLLLAKGEMQGVLDIKKPTLLRGVGFTYDFDDEEGPSRDIRTGQTTHDSPKMALIQPGDTLITSGLDGVFPKGLFVAEVKKVLPLEEGAFSYEIRAEVAYPYFLDLSSVALLPPMPQEPERDSADVQELMKQIEQELGAVAV